MMNFVLDNFHKDRMLSEAFEQLDKEGCLILEDLESSFDDFKVKPFKNSICEMMKMFA